MEWIKAKLYTASEGLESVFAVLADVGIENIQIEDTQDMRLFLQNTTPRDISPQWDYVDEALLNAPNAETCVIFYVGANAAGHEKLLLARAAVERLRAFAPASELGRLVLEVETVNDESWLNEWKKYYKPFAIGRVMVKPVWESMEAKPGEIVFNINPGHVFGTGLHQTTQLCIKALEKVVNKETVLLDLGCGSGILSIIGLLLSAQSAVAVDIDQNAVDIAYENAALNHIAKDRYTVLSGNVLTDAALCDTVTQTAAYNIVVANIVADVIINIAGFVADCLQTYGIFIASGIIGERLTEVREAFAASGFKITEITEQDDWFCVVGQKT